MQTRTRGMGAVTTPEGCILADALFHLPQNNADRHTRHASDIPPERHHGRGKDKIPFLVDLPLDEVNRVLYPR